MLKNAHLDCNIGAGSACTKMPGFGSSDLPGTLSLDWNSGSLMVLTLDGNSEHEGK